MVEEAPAPRVFEWPALRVNHTARLMFLGRNVPQFLDSKAEYLWSALLAKAENFRKALGQMPPRAFCEEGVVRMQLHPRLVVGAMRPVASDAHITGRHALHRPVLVEQDLGRGKA